MLKKKINKLFALSVSTLMFATGMLPSISTPNVAEAASGTMNVYFPESNSRTQTKTVTINNLTGVQSATVDTGNVSYNVNGDQVTITVSNGSWTSRDSYYDSTKYSKSVSDYQTSSTDSFPSSMSYSDGSGYSGTMYKNGGSYVSSGSYTPEQSRYESGTKSDGGRCDEDNPQWDRCKSKEESGMYPSYSYNSGGYSGTLYETSYQYTSTPFTYSSGGTTKNGYNWTRYQEYGGTVTKPASDTRVYRQDYSGTAYKGGTSYNNYRYSYNVTLNYTTNDAPGLVVNSIDKNMAGNQDTITFSGTISDLENDSVTISASLGGANASTVVPNGNGTWNLVFNAIDITEGDYNTITVTASDGYDTVSKTFSYTLTVDNTDPFVWVHNLSPNKPTNGTVDIQVNAGDAYTGVREIGMPNGSFVSKKTTVYTVSDNGDYTFTVKDNVGNEISHIISVSNIDKNAPTITALTLHEKKNGDYLVIVDAEDYSGIDYVLLNNSQTISKSTKSNNYEIDNLPIKPSYVVVQDKAGNQTGNIYFLDTPSMTFDSSYSSSKTMKEDFKVSIDGSDVITYKIGSRYYECASKPCDATITKNSDLTGINSTDTKASMKTIEINNVDKSPVNLILSGWRTADNEKEVNLDWNIIVQNPSIICDAWDRTEMHTPLVKPYKFNGENETYECTLEGNYEGNQVTSNTITISPDYLKQLPSFNPSADLQHKNVKSNVFIEKTTSGETYFFNIRRSNSDGSGIPLPSFITN